jgi:hypothetical protein
MLKLDYQSSYVHEQRRQKKRTDSWPTMTIVETSRDKTI